MIRAALLWTRRLRRETALVTFLVLSLAISLGGSIVALTLSSALLWRALPFSDAARLVTLEPREADTQARWLSLPEFQALTDAPLAPFDSIAGYTVADFSALAEPGAPPEPLLGTMVSPQFFALFGIRPEHGRLPEPTAQASTGERVVLVSHELWQRRYRGASNIVGRSIRLAGPAYLRGSDGDYRIIGVLPRDLWLFWKRFDLVLPLGAGLDMRQDANAGVIERVVARIGHGSDVAAARLVSGMALGRVRAAGATTPPASLTVDSLQSAQFRNLRPQLLTVLAIAAVVLGLALTNVMLAALAQAASRRRETAIRIAIGAGGWRLFVDAVRENAITSCIAGAAGAVLGIWLTSIVSTQVPNQWLSRIPGEAAAFRFDAPVAWSLLAILVSVVLLTSLAVQSTVRKLRPWSLLGSAIAAESRGSHLLRSSLVVSEIALCACAVGTAGVLLFQLLSLRGVDVGIDPTRAVAAWINVTLSKYGDDASRAAYYDAVLQRLRSLPEVESVGGVDLPFHFTWQTMQVRADANPDDVAVTALDRAATPGYLEATGIQLREGRWISEQDRRGAASVAVVSESLARRLWPDRAVLGQTIRIGGTQTSPPALATVIGVVTDTRHAPHQPPDRALYRAVAQAAPPWLYLMVRTRAGAGSITSGLTAAIWQLDRDQPIDGPWPVVEWIDDQTTYLGFVVLLTGVLSAVGAMLAAAGLYGLTAVWVSESRRDLGIRRAMGAGNRQIAWWFAARWAAIVLPGLAVGILLQWAAVRALIAGIEGIQTPTWPQALVGVAAVSACAACGAAVPFRRALQADAHALMR